MVLFVFVLDLKEDMKDEKEAAEERQLVKAEDYYIVPSIVP